MRLIDAEPWAESIQKDFCDGCDNYGGVRCSCCKVEDILVALEEAPTIEAKPVVHAHWNDDGRCTNCGGHAPFFAWTDEWFGTKFCPHCGAQIHKSISCNHEDDNHIAEDGKKGIKIPVISMEDVPKLAKEMEK